MANKLLCHAGDIVLLRAEIIGLGSDGPYVRIETGSGGATCFWAPVAAVVHVERAFDMPTEASQLSRPVPPRDGRGRGVLRHLTTRHDEPRA
jgi:hypothetical protein